MKYIAILLTALFLTLGVPGTSNAYFTTGQTAFTANGTVGVFVIDFKFGHEKHDVRIPVQARMNTEPSDAALVFDVIHEAGAKGQGNAVGIVLADADIENGKYVIPKGFSKTLRLLVLYTKASHESGQFRANVTHLPFSFDGAQELRLNRSELTYYQTSLINLNTPAPQAEVTQK